ncbi:hypothetical protein [Microbacterium testaceum]|uniref:hypothetical protein n=1 Tax=Microbacterium testaceum TaxID=2033 RepID=UPI00128F161A|nr:hypothetical protein [Microbacterium testaceum]
MSAYNLLEAFIEARLAELTTHINQGHLHFADLPDRVQKQATRNLLGVANARARRIPDADLRGFVQAVGESLSAVNGAINLSSLTWMWSGSNMGASDYAAVLKSFHVESPWTSTAALSARIGASATDPQSELEAFAQERHRAAHDSTHQVSNLSIGLAIDRLVTFSITLDSFASVGAAALRRADAAFLGDKDWTTSVIGVRRVKQRAADWAEYTENGTTAFRVGSDRHTVTMAAAQRCSDQDVLVVTDSTGQIIDWSVPAVG